MKTNYALAAVVPKPEDPKKGSVVHVCFYEESPSQFDVNALVEELATDTEFSMTHMVCDQDYFLQHFAGEVLEQLKADMGIPDDIEE